MKKLLILALFIASCKTDAPEVEKAEPTCVPPSISYQRDIKPIITANCNTGSGCHSSGSPNGNFFNYDQLNATCIDGSFKKKVLIDKTMPPNGMDSCDYLTLRRWFNNGHYN